MKFVLFVKDSVTGKSNMHISCSQQYSELREYIYGNLKTVLLFVPLLALHEQNLSYLINQRFWTESQVRFIKSDWCQHSKNNMIRSTEEWNSANKNVEYSLVFVCCQYTKNLRNTSRHITQKTKITKEIIFYVGQFKLVLEIHIINMRTINHLLCSKEVHFMRKIMLFSLVINKLKYTVVSS